MTDSVERFDVPMSTVVPRLLMIDEVLELALKFHVIVRCRIGLTKLPSD